MTHDTATPSSAEYPDYDGYTCKYCHQGIKRVPGGHGTVWVHDDGYRMCQKQDQA